MLYLFCDTLTLCRLGRAFLVHLVVCHLLGLLVSYKLLRDAEGKSINQMSQTRITLPVFAFRN
jgi:hypothetical protein